MSSSRQIETQAAMWLARRDAAGWSLADEDALVAWLDASTAHKVAFIRLEAAWNASRRLKALGAGIPQGVVPARVWRRSRVFGRRGEGRPVRQDGRPTERTRAAASDAAASPLRRGRMGLYSLAAGLLIAAALGGVWLFWPEGSVYRTAVGGLEAVPMRDGSKVTLNTDTDIRVLLTRSERRVDLERGEAFFEVAHDTTRPFIVRAGNSRIVVVGTKFSVRREAHEVRVMVTEGKVRVESGGGAGAAPLTFVRAGNIARAQESGVLVSPESAAEAEAALGWRHGYVVLHDTPIAEAAAEFNRYNMKKIVIQDPGVGEIRIGGNFRSTSTDAFVRLLVDGFPIRVEEREGEIVLTHR